MPPVRVLSFDQVGTVLADLQADEVLTNQAQSFYAFTNQKTQTPQRLTTTSEKHTTLYMPARIDSMTSVVKIVSVPKQSSPFGLPGFSVVLDNETAEAKGLVNARLLTATRTAAGSAFATKMILEARLKVLRQAATAGATQKSGKGALSSSSSLNLVIFGSGAQAKAHVQLIVTSVPKPFKIAKVTIVNRTAPRAKALLDDLSKLFPSLPLDLVLTDDDSTDSSSSSLEQTVREADIICTCTNARAPLFDGSWVRPGTHLNLVGSFTPEMQEIDQSLVQRSYVVVDSQEACGHEAGELIRADKFKADHPQESTYRGVLAELGELVDAHGRILDDKLPTEWKKMEDEIQQGGRPGHVTLFKSVGIAAQDVAITCLVLDRAETRNIGTVVDL